VVDQGPSGVPDQSATDLPPAEGPQPPPVLGEADEGGTSPIEPGPLQAPVAAVTIDWDVIFQTIDGFGVAQAGVFAHMLNSWPEPQRRQILDLAFSRVNGIGLTIFRTMIPPELEATEGAWNYSDIDQVSLMKEAVRRGATKLFASVASPPAWMKTSKSTLRGELKPENYQDFADFLSHYASEYAHANDVDIYAVSMTNEPDTIFAEDEDAWDTCAWNSDQIATFLSDYLAPTFAAHQITAEVIAPETSNWESAEAYLASTYDNPTATDRLNIVGAHPYFGDPSLVFEQALSIGKRVWQTEASSKFSVESIDGALDWATMIHHSLVDAQVSAWVWWLLALWPHDNQALISLYQSSPPGAFIVKKAMWALGNFSLFIRPGFVRIGATSHTPTLLASAYKDTEAGQFVIVAINTGTSDQAVTFSNVGFTAEVTPFVTSQTQDTTSLPAVSLADTVTVPARSIVSYVGPPVVSLRQPDGMILSTANLYFTSHDELGAHVFRTAQTSSPGQEIELYREPPGNRFGDIVFANVGGVFYGYFFAMDSSGQVFIKRVPLTGSSEATKLTPPLPNIDIVNSHHNLATDNVNLYWQDVSSIKKIPIDGVSNASAIITLDQATPNTPTAGVYLRGATIVYASVAAVRYVPTSGPITIPLVRTIANANTTVTTILPVANGTYWGDRNGAIQLQLGTTTHTIQGNSGLVPTSLGTNGFTAGGALVWTQCASSTCQMRLHFPSGDTTFPVGNHALGASINSSGHVFWGDDFGVHRLVF
jgi:glucuronoarabinoxylan endo-1,4-beta-xylanase